MVSLLALHSGDLISFVYCVSLACFSVPVHRSEKWDINGMAATVDSELYDGESNRAIRFTVEKQRTSFVKGPCVCVLWTRLNCGGMDDVFMVHFVPAVAR